MLLVNFMGLLMTTAVTATPVVKQIRDSIKWTPDHVLQPGEVILYGEGRSRLHELNDFNNGK